MHEFAVKCLGIIGLNSLPIFCMQLCFYFKDKYKLINYSLWEPIFSGSLFKKNYNSEYAQNLNTYSCRTIGSIKHCRLNLN